MVTHYPELESSLGGKENLLLTLRLEIIPKLTVTSAPTPAIWISFLVSGSTLILAMQHQGRSFLWNPVLTSFQNFGAFEMTIDDRSDVLNFWQLAFKLILLFPQYHQLFRDANSCWRRQLFCELRLDSLAIDSLLPDSTFCRSRRPRHSSCSWNFKEFFDHELRWLGARISS